MQQVHRLSGIKHHHAVFDDLEAEDDDDEDLLRDDFSLNKMIILVTSAGKVSNKREYIGCFVVKSVQIIKSFLQFPHRELIFEALFIAPACSRVRYRCPIFCPSVRPSVRLTFDIYVKVSILINYKTKQPSNLA